MRTFTLLSLLLFTLLQSSCTKDFEEINTNPNVAVEAQPELLLRQVLYNTVEEMSYEGFVAGNLLSQHFTMVDFNLFDRHNLSQPQLGGNPWPVLYLNLRDNEQLLQKARSGDAFAVYEGPALILKAYLAATLSDIYGDVPYFQAFQGKSLTVTPAYDSQELIYTGTDGILENLREGIAKVSNYNGAAALKGDILYNGLLSNWEKLGHSLLIKYLIRISERVDVSAELQTLYSNGVYIKTSAEDATYQFTDGPPNNFRMATLRSGDFNLFVMSQTSEELFEKYQDPRRQVYFRPIANDTGSVSSYKGLLNGPDASQTSISIADYSLAGTVFRENTGALKSSYISSWETHFLLAEAAERGLIAADPKALYETAVQQAFDYWNTPLPATYLSSGPASYQSNGANGLEQIMEQKWIANILNGYESWIEYRRTGFPQLKTIAASLNNDLIPVRMPYPSDEQALNRDNFVVAAAATNGNSVNVKTWWDNN
jgi:hypothetical protein